MAFVLESKLEISTLDWPSEFYLIVEEGRLREHAFHAVIEPDIRYFDPSDTILFQKTFGFSPADEPALFEAKSDAAERERILRFVSERAKSVPSVSKERNGFISKRAMISIASGGPVVFFWDGLDNPQTLEDILAWDWDLAYMEEEGNPILLEKSITVIPLFSPERAGEGVLRCETITGKPMFVDEKRVPPLILTEKHDLDYKTDIYSVLEDGETFEDEEAEALIFNLDKNACANRRTP